MAFEAATSCIEAEEGAPVAVLGGFITGRVPLRTARRQRPWRPVEFELTEMGVRLPVTETGDERPNWLHVLAQHRAAAGAPLPAGPHILRPPPGETPRRLRVQAVGDGELAAGGRAA